MRILLLILALAAVFALMSMLAVYSYGRFARQARGSPGFFLAPGGTATALDEAVARLGPAQAGETGLVLLADNLHAFALRASLARSAQRSLDLQYYYWKEDLTGSLLAREILRAADRGVRVRVLLDDINMRGDREWRALDRHPHIEVRLFNPCRNREPGFRRGLELMLRAFSTTRRMHNKAWIADGRAAIVGGRNIGDAYFDASEEANFLDMDLLVAGPAVGRASAVFDLFWNSAAVLPIRTLTLARRGNLRRLRRRMETLERKPAGAPYRRAMEENAGAPAEWRARAFHWTSRAEIVSDPPEKAGGGGREGWLSQTIMPVIAQAREEVAIVSPYFIPGEEGVRDLAALAARGVEVTVLTNSLAATDVAAVHGAYARYRLPLLEAGVRLYELKPELRRQRISLFGSRRASLHTKAFMVDNRRCFVGSFNFDPRSVSLNTEVGVLFTQEELAREMKAEFAGHLSPHNSYRLVLENGAIVWEDAPGRPRLTREPAAGTGRRLLAGLIGRLPIESQL